MTNEANETSLSDLVWDEAYNKGYADGRDKAFFEIEATLDEQPHAVDCGCRPCDIIAKVRLVRAEEDWPGRPVFDPDDTLAAQVWARFRRARFRGMQVLRKRHSQTDSHRP